MIWDRREGLNICESDMCVLFNSRTLQLVSLQVGNMAPGEGGLDRKGQTRLERKAFHVIAYLQSKAASVS